VSATQSERTRRKVPEPRRILAQHQVPTFSSFFESPELAAHRSCFSSLLLLRREGPGQGADQHHCARPRPCRHTMERGNAALRDQFEDQTRHLGSLSKCPTRCRPRNRALTNRLAAIHDPFGHADVHASTNRGPFKRRIHRRHALSCSSCTVPGQFRLGEHNLGGLAFRRSLCSCRGQRRQGKACLEMRPAASGAECSLQPVPFALVPRQPEAEPCIRVREAARPKMVPG
jgi:hypothetical protein